MRALIVSVLLCFHGISHAADAPASDPHFQEKLQVMLQRTEKSIKLIREQITQNQSAPFLANLYLQLGDLLSEKSTSLYYLQMERDKNTELKVQATKKFSPVVAAEQEAIGIYQQILREFPKFNETDKVMYRLAVAQKSIDEGAAFVDTADKLIRAYPNSKEAIQVRLLLGQHFYDMQDNNQALIYLNAIKDCPYPYERNAARYRIGLIDIAQENNSEALKFFEQVAADNELKEEDNPQEVSLKTKTIKTNVKREALIDSVRAYTEVYKENPDPVAYYSRIAPTELLFQETIEKLAYRYIFLKKYNFAIKLLRTLSERTADPQKIVNIYHEVLLMIPIQDRIGLPVLEMQFVLERYNYWSTHYSLSPDLKRQAFDFFETQIRELGTHSHALAKAANDHQKKAEFYERARQFYQLYIGFFDKGPRTVKIAIDLADVYFNQANYLESGSYYLRVFSGEFGPPTDKAQLLQNAILALQKPAEYPFYEQLRVKGLLVKAIRTYQNFDKKQRSNPELNFTLAKTFYEQGFYNHALNDLLQFMKRYPTSKEVDAAADLILYYFNIRSDFRGLVDWTQKMLALHLNQNLRKRLQEVRSKALLRRLDEQVKTQKGYDVFAQGKSYLQTALTSGDSNLRSAAFEQALGRSKAEKDIETFLIAAGAMAKAEPKPQKRADLLSSLADETLAITRFAQTFEIWNRTLKDSSVAAKFRQQTFEKSFKLSLMLRDFNRLSNLAGNPMFNSLSEDTKKTLQQQLAGLMESSVNLPANLYRAFYKSAKNDEDLVSMFKAQYKMPENMRRSLLQQTAARCKDSTRTTLCKWQNWPRAARDIQSFSEVLRKTPTTLNSIDSVAQRMNGLLEELKLYEGSGDPQLDIFLSLGTAGVYDDFAEFLAKTAKANQNVAAVQPILKQKVAESQNSAQKSRAQCRTVIASASLNSPTNRACYEGKLPNLQEGLRWRKLTELRPVGGDPKSPSIVDQEKKIFVERKDWKLYFDLAETYLNQKNYHYAAATSVYGASTFPKNQEEFNAILGCSVLHLGFLNEAQFHLTKASDINGHKESCLSEMKSGGL